MLTDQALSESEKKEIRLQIERIVASSFFRASSRYPSLLQYVVERTIEGKAESLKERTLGIEVFGRESSFETSGDSIVRVTAAEVRKRLAQYYQESGHGNEIRISLIPGSYVPHFLFPQKIDTVDISLDQPLIRKEIPNEYIAPHDAVAPRPHRRRLERFAIVVGILAVGMTAAVMTLRDKAKNSLLEPLWDSPSQVTMCLGTSPVSTPIPLGNPGINNTILPFGDALAVSRLQGALMNRHRRFLIRSSNVASYEDLRNGPIILVGAFNNDWTMRITKNLRFRFAKDNPRFGYIVDSKGGPNAHWETDYGTQYSDLSQDYAIVAFMNDDMLGQPVLVVAGLGPNGTMAASEFFTSDASATQLRHLAPRGWSGRNFEAVLATQVVQGNSGPPQIISAEFW